MRPMMERLRSLFINAVFLSLLSLLEYELEGAFNRSVNFLKKTCGLPQSSAGPRSREREPAALWTKEWYDYFAERMRSSKAVSAAFAPSPIAMTICL